MDAWLRWPDASALCFENQRRHVLGRYSVGGAAVLLRLNRGGLILGFPTFRGYEGA